MTERREQKALALELRAVEMYAAGAKVQDIAAEVGKPISTVYWFLEKHGVAPSRANRRSRIVDDATVEALYELIMHQNARIEEADTVTRLTELAERKGVSAALAQAITELQQAQAKLAWWRQRHPRTHEPE